jgi:hypothetical protein
MDASTVLERAGLHRLGTGLLDNEARDHLRKFSEQIAQNFVDGSEPLATDAYREYVTETVHTWLIDCLDEIAVQVASDWERENEIGAAADLDNSRDLG